MPHSLSRSNELKKRLFKTVLLTAIISGLCFLVIGAASVHGMPKPELIALMILMVAAILWITELVPLFVTSFVILFLAIVWLLPELDQEQLKVTKETFLSPFFSDIILLFLGGFVLSSALHKYQLDEQLARCIIRKTGGSLPRLMLGVMLTTAVLSMFLSNTATSAMMLALVLPIVQGMPEGAPSRKAVVLAVPFAANAGGLGTPIGSPPNAIAMQYMRDIGIAPSFGEWMLVGIPASIVIVFIAWGLLVFIFKARGSVPESKTKPPTFSFNPGIGLVLAVSLITVAGWMTSGWHGLSTGTVSLIPLILFFGIGILNVRDLRSLSWDVLLVMGGGLCLGATISVSGLAGWIVAQLNVDAYGVYGVMLIFGVLACVMSSVMSNTATANLILPIVLGLSIEPISPILFGVAFCCSLAMALPISTPPNAMAFSSGEIKVKDLLKPGLPITLIGIALVFTIGYWWWGIVGLF